MSDLDFLFFNQPVIDIVGKNVNKNNDKTLINKVFMFLLFIAKE